MKKEAEVSLVTERVPHNETAFLLPILADAEEGEERIRATLLDPTCTTYASWLDGQLAGAAVVRWEQDEPSEIVYIAVAAALRGRGYGKQIIHVLQEELREPWRACASGWDGKCGTCKHCLLPEMRFPHVCNQARLFCIYSAANSRARDCAPRYVSFAL